MQNMDDFIISFIVFNENNGVFEVFCASKYITEGPGKR